MLSNLSDKIILEIRKIGAKYPVDKIVLFGSRARGDNKPTSDIDLAIFISSDFKSAGYLASDVDDLETLLKIDVVFINEKTDKKLVENIRREGVVLYEQEEN